MKIEVDLVIMKSGIFFAPCPSNLGLSNLEVLLLKGQIILPKNIAIVLLSSFNFQFIIWVLLWLTQWVDKEVTLPPGIIDHIRKTLGFIRQDE